MRLNPYLVRPGLALVTGAQGDGGDGGNDTESEPAITEDTEAGAAIAPGKEAKQPSAKDPVIESDVGGAEIEAGVG